MRLALSAWLLLCAAAIKSGGYNYMSLAAHADFNAYCDWTEILLNLALLVPVLAAVAFAGRRAMRLLGLESGLALDFFCGVALFNICLLPFFFAGLAYRGVVLALLLAFLLFGDSGVSWPRLPQSRLWSALVLIVIVWAAYHCLLSALSPVSYGESLGDVSGGYMPTYIFFSEHHGVAVEPALVTYLFALHQYSVVASALITISNPGIVKMFGLMLLFCMSLGIYEFLGVRLPRWLAFAAAAAFLATPALSSNDFFSLAHDRLYLMFLECFAFISIVEGMLFREPNRHCLAFAGIGLMSSVSMAGIVPAAASFGGIVLFSGLWREFPKRYLLALAACAAAAGAFPAWNFHHTGCIYPGNPFFVKLFHASGSPYVINDFIGERLLMFFDMRYSPGAWSYAVFPFSFAFEHAGLLGGMLFIGFAFIRRAEVAAMYFMLFFMLYSLLLFFPNMVSGGVLSRFAWITLPALYIASFYFLSQCLAKRPGLDEVAR
ncbi:MAG: hypothetical protein GX410_03960 [Elusimicrobia bacterium]|nr:hypothetical protein [Elusimicrobiota bacterium]